MKIIHRIYAALLGLLIRILPTSVDALVGVLQRLVSNLERAEAMLLNAANKEFDLQTASYTRQSAIAQKERAFRNASSDRADRYATEAARAARIRSRVNDLLA